MMHAKQVSEFIKQALRDAELGEMDGCFLDGRGGWVCLQHRVLCCAVRVVLLHLK